MKKLRVLIADDEPLAREGLAMLLRDDPEFELVSVCDDGRAALAGIRARRPDLVLLDVQMPECSGLEVYASLAEHERPPVIFVTAYDRHAVEAFEVRAIDYVLKPFRDDRLREALTRAKEKIRRSPSPDRAGGRVVFKVADGLQFFSSEDILWCEAQGGGVKIGSAGQIYEIREPLGSVERRLDPNVFVRIHRSFIANLAGIRKIMPDRYGDYVVEMRDGVRLRLSRTHRHQLETLLATTGT